MDFLSFLVLCVIAFFLWRISDQMPDILFRLSELQKDIAKLRRQRRTQTTFKRDMKMDWRIFWVCRLRRFG